MSAEAQTIERPERPIRGLFGGRLPQDPARPLQEVVFTATAQGGYDDSALRGSEKATRPPGYLGFANAALRYERVAERKVLGIDGSGYMNTYRNLGLSPRYGGTVNASLSTPVGRRSQISLVGTGRTDPIYALSSFGPLRQDVGAGVLPDSNPANGFVGLRSWGRTVSARLSSKISRRGDIDVGYRYDLRGFEDRDEGGGGGDGFDQAVDLAFRHAVGRASGLGGSFGYGLSEVQDGIVARNIRHQTAEFGYEFERSLSPTRRLEFSFGAGATRALEDDRSLGQATAYVFSSGYSRVRLDLVRTWRVEGNYRRGVDVLRGLTAQTFISHAAVGSVGGFVHPRAELGLSVAYSNGRQPLELPAAYDSYSASVQLQYKLTPWLAASADYNFSAYHLRSFTDLPVGFTSRLNRSAIRVGVAMWLPLYGAFPDNPRGGRE